MAAFCLGSCLSTSDELDLDKDISLDMQIAPGGLSIPLGSLDTLFLDSLIKIDDEDAMLKKLPDVIRSLFAVLTKSFVTFIDSPALSTKVNLYMLCRLWNVAGLVSMVPSVALVTFTFAMA